MSEQSSIVKRCCRRCKAHGLKSAVHVSVCPFRKCQCPECTKIAKNNEVAKERARKRRSDEDTALTPTSSASAVTMGQVLELADQNSSEERRHKQLSAAARQAEKLRQKKKDLGEYDIFINNYMASLGDTRSPLANMALATQAWREKQQKPISKRVSTVHARQDEELQMLGFEEYNAVKHINMGLPSSVGDGNNNSPLSTLGVIFPQLPSSHLERHLTSANGELDQAANAIMLETQTQDISCLAIPDQDPPKAEDILIQMFPQYNRGGIACALQSCDNNLYKTVDLLLKLLPEESKQRDVTTISFSHTVSSAINNIPQAPLNPFAMALGKPTPSENSRKTIFCKRCGHVVPHGFMGPLCPNPSCSYPFQFNLRM